MGAGWGLAGLAGLAGPGRDQNSVRVFVSDWAGRLLLASPASPARHRPGFACARASCRARAGRRAAGMTQLRLSTLEPRIKILRAALWSSSTSLFRFFLPLPRLLAPLSPPTSRTMPRAGQMQHCRSGIREQQPHPKDRVGVVSLTSRGTGDCQTGRDEVKNPADSASISTTQRGPDDWT